MLEFAAHSMTPGIASWLIADTIRGTDRPPGQDLAGGRIEIWNGTVTTGPFGYPHLAVGYGSHGGIVAIVAAEVLPEVHDEVHLGLFHGGGHRNFGPGAWLDPRVFRQTATRLVVPLIRADAPLRRAGFSASIQLRGPLDEAESAGLRQKLHDEGVKREWPHCPLDVLETTIEPWGNAGREETELTAVLAWLPVLADAARASGSDLGVGVVERRRLPPDDAALEYRIVVDVEGDYCRVNLPGPDGELTLAEWLSLRTTSPDSNGGEPMDRNGESSR